MRERFPLSVSSPGDLALAKKSVGSEVWDESAAMLAAPSYDTVLKKSKKGSRPSGPKKPGQGESSGSSPCMFHKVVLIAAKSGRKRNRMAPSWDHFEENCTSCAAHDLNGSSRNRGLSPQDDLRFFIPFSRIFLVQIRRTNEIVQMPGESNKAKSLLWCAQVVTIPRGPGETASTRRFSRPPGV